MVISWNANFCLLVDVALELATAIFFLSGFSFTYTDTDNFAREMTITYIFLVAIKKVNLNL